MAGGTGQEGDRVSSPPPPRGPDDPTVKPCWVTDRHGRLQAAARVAAASGWQGRVVRPVLEVGDWIVVEEWLPEELLEGG